MAIQLLPGQSRASSLGESLGTGLGQGLQLLAQDKLNKILQARQRKQTATGLSALGISPQEAEQIAYLPKELQGAVLKNYLAGAESAGLDQALSALTGAPSVSGIEALGTQQEAMPQKGVGSILTKPRLSPEQRIKLTEMGLKQQEIQKKAIREEQKASDKETLPYYKEIIKKYSDAKENDRRLGRMEQLVRKGKLDSPIVSSLFDTASKGILGFGINLDSLRSPDSQEFKKLSTEFLKNAKALFGPRVTQQEIVMFMKMVPTLMQSDKGKLRVINNMKVYNQAELIKKQAMDYIIKNNGGKRPANLESLVEQTVEPTLDKLAEEFKKGYKIEAEPEEDRSSFIQRARNYLWENIPFKL